MQTLSTTTEEMVLTRKQYHDFSTAEACAWAVYVEVLSPDSILKKW
jgi:hypothetical protein